MIPKFIQPAFIRRNTPELRKKLEDLGYANIQKAGWDDKGINKCRLLWTDYNGFYFHHYIEARPKTFFETHIDCGENERLFLALAALRDDSDKFQWFVRDEPHETYSKFTLCELDDWDSDFYSWSNDDDIFPYMYHKATPSELIEHFKEN